MNREDTLNTTKRVLDLIEAKSLECAPSAKRLPSSMFVERERFEQDKALLARSPHVIGYACEIKRGHYLTRSVASVPVLLVRDNKDVLRAFINACAHRGACVAHGEGKAQRLNAVTTPGATTRKAILSLGRARNILRGLTKLRWG